MSSWNDVFRQQRERNRARMAQPPTGKGRARPAAPAHSGLGGPGSYSDRWVGVITGSRPAQGESAPAPAATAAALAAMIAPREAPLSDPYAWHRFAVAMVTVIDPGQAETQREPRLLESQQAGELVTEQLLGFHSRAERGPEPVLPDPGPVPLEQTTITINPSTQSRR